MICAHSSKHTDLNRMTNDLHPDGVRGLEAGIRIWSTHSFLPNVALLLLLLPLRSR